MLDIYAARPAMVSNPPSATVLVLEDRLRVLCRRAMCRSGMLLPKQSRLSTPTLVLPLLWEVYSGRPMVSISPSLHLLSLEDRLRALCRRTLYRSGSGMLSLKQSRLSTPPPPPPLILSLVI